MTAIPATRYDSVAMSLHWIIAVLMTFMIFFGEDLMGEGEDEAVAGTLLPSVHVTIGSAILVLSLARLAWRLVNPPPMLPRTMAPWELMASKASHFLFYVLMIGLPITGWFAFGEFVREEPVMAGVTIFSLIGVPATPSFGEAPAEVHEIASTVAMVLVILHTLAALKHQFINRDSIMARMLPGRFG